MEVNTCHTHNYRQFPTQCTLNVPKARKKCNETTIRCTAVGSTPSTTLGSDCSTSTATKSSSVKTFGFSGNKPVALNPASPLLIVATSENAFLTNDATSYGVILSATFSDFIYVEPLLYINKIAFSYISCFERSKKETSSGCMR
ncbi:unnamed protein product [Leptosia nina]|uniref:Uncharacterized protein n=1 Tax=Leptosia nina TaxID=320188 RepID=A0AAV1JXD9_9NEOP